ncbi:MAG TPA: YidC/Oxa1 family membrane protein insertase [Candidatus Scatovivens faecipullorum]|nr:YidC/Oxa1 family membrane protein insertase [Candidatus Scatovivens faecipullorum]
MDFLANIFGYLLNFIYQIVNNYGIAMIIFTIILKLIMLPISIKQQKTLKKSAKMQVKVKEIQEKYSNDQVRQSQELMDLYKRENMSPFSGCLSSIIQLIIVLSMFYLVSRPLTYMKHIDTDLLNQYTQEVAASTEGALRYPEIAIIKAMSDKDENIRINMDFFGLDLSDIPTQNYKDLKVYIIPLLYVFTSFISIRLTTNLNKKKQEEKNNKEELIKENIDKTKENNKEKLPVKVEEKQEDKEIDTMEEMQRQMNFMMPVMAVSIALIAPLGLALYWLVSNLLMIIERLIINKFFKDEEEE